VKLVLDLPAPSDPAARAARPGVASDEVDDLDGFFPLLVTARRARRPWLVLTTEQARTAAQGSFFSRWLCAGMTGQTSSPGEDYR
jgi:hypothetical protein